MSRSEVPVTSDDALRLAIKLASDAGEYDRAGALLDILRRRPQAGTVTAIAPMRLRPNS
jgi:hypothetical protein